MKDFFIRKILRFGKIEKKKTHNSQTTAKNTYIAFEVGVREKGL